MKLAPHFALLLIHSHDHLLSSASYHRVSLKHCHHRCQTPENVTGDSPYGGGWPLLFFLLHFGNFSPPPSIFVLLLLSLKSLLKIPICAAIWCLFWCLETLWIMVYGLISFPSIWRRLIPLFLIIFASWSIYPFFLNFHVLLLSTTWFWCILTFSKTLY